MAPRYAPAVEVAGLGWPGPGLCARRETEGEGEAGARTGDALAGRDCPACISLLRVCGEACRVWRGGRLRRGGGEGEGGEQLRVRRGEIGRGEDGGQC